MSLRLVHPHAPRLDDPQPPLKGVELQCGDKLSEAIHDQPAVCTRPWLKDDNSRRLLRRKTQDLAEVVVQRDKNALLFDGDSKQY
jgi:hypothetical protein